MTQVELFNLLKTIGYPVAYDHFEADDDSPPPDPPFILYLIPNSKSYGPDDSRALIRDSYYRVELYTDIKDIAAESKVESTLDAASIQYDKTETYIQSEKLYQIIYDFNFIEKI